MRNENASTVPSTLISSMRGMLSWLPIDARQCRRERPKHPDTTEREQHADDSSTQPECQALGEEISNQSSAAGAEGTTNGDLALPRCRSCENQIRNVDAGEQEQKSNGDGQDDERRLDRTDSS